jgi:two-component system, OmpR family, KDP operon response regulator KdpE
MSGAHILIVDDDRQLHRFLKPALEAAGYLVKGAFTAAEGLRLAATRGPALILLDLGLPDLDGQDALKRLRLVSLAPIIVVSARSGEHDKITALDAGADDYVIKPFALGEMLARLRTCLRRAHGHTEAKQEVWRCRGVEVDLSRRRVSVDAVPVILSRREYDLLAVLVRNAGRVLTHRRLLTAVWGANHGDHVQYLRVYIGHLRHKLGPAGAGLIETEGGIGYRMAESEPIK